MENESEKTTEKDNDFEQSVIHLLTTYLLNKNEEQERQKFGEALIKVLQENIKDLAIRVEQKKAKDALVDDLKTSIDHAHLVDQTIENELNEMMGDHT